MASACWALLASRAGLRSRSSSVTPLPLLSLPESHRPPHTGERLSRPPSTSVFRTPSRNTQLSPFPGPFLGGCLGENVPGLC